MGAVRNAAFEAKWVALGLDRLPHTLGTAATLRVEDVLALEPAVVATPAATAASAEVAFPSAMAPVATHRLPALSLSLGPTIGATPPASTDDLEVAGVLGEGGMGRVLVARQRSLGREVALKVLRSEHASERAHRALLHEARIAGALEHPGIIPVHALGLDRDGQPVLVMKRIEGVSWLALIRSPDDPAWARLLAGGKERLDVHLEVLLAVCDVLSFAHDRGVLHRDVKPENVMVGAFGERYLVDWGLALRMSEASSEVTSAVVGTPAYMAPEMLAGNETSCTPRTDVYLLGATLHHVLTGEARHTGESVREALCSAFESLPFGYPASVPRELGELANSATSRDPAARPASALAFRAALEEHFRHRASHALATRGAARVDAIDARLAEQPPGSRPEPVASEDHAALARAGAEARLCLEQALREWPGNAFARETFARCLESLAELELRRGNADAVRALLAELSPPPKGLVERLAALESTARARHEQAEKFAQLQRDFDPSVSARHRGIVASILGTALIAHVVYTLATGATYGPLSILKINAVAIAFLATTFLIGRRHLTKNRVNRQIGAVLGLILGALFSHHAVAAILEQPVGDIFATDLWMLSGIAGVIAIVRVWLFVVPSAMFACAAIFASVWPDRAHVIFELAGALMMTLMVVASVRAARGKLVIQP